MGYSIVIKGLLWIGLGLSFCTPIAVYGQSDEPVRRAEERGERPPMDRRSEGKRRVPVQFDQTQNDCAVVFMKDFCLNGDIEQQLQTTPMDKLASYGIRDVYQYKRRGTTTTAYAIEGKVANVIVEFAKKRHPRDRQGKNQRGESSERYQRDDRRRQGGPRKGLLNHIFAIVDRHAEQYGNALGAKAVEQSLDKIHQQGQGGQTWEFTNWQFYVERTNNGSVIAEAFVPRLEAIEQQAKTVKVGSRLTGIWQNRHKIEIYINGQNGKQLSGKMQFLSQVQGAMDVSLEQTDSSRLKFKAVNNQGEVFQFNSDSPRGDKNRCYHWELLVAGQNRQKSLRPDGSLKLCQ